MKKIVLIVIGITSVLIFGQSALSVDNEMQRGEDLYIQQCSKCHRKSGSGVKLVYPPLKNADYVQKGDKIELLRGMIYGREGRITVNGYTYQGVMTTEVDKSLTDNDIAIILNYVLKRLNNIDIRATGDDVRKAKKMGKLPVHNK